MAESGGPTTQQGIFYQNTVAAKYLADLLDLGRSSPRDRVTEVRVEAPSDVDDVVVSYADGHRDWIQVKTRLRRSGDAWTGLWRDLSSQFADPGFSGEDRLVVVLGTADATATNLRTLTERAASVVELDEWHASLSGDQASLLTGIEAVLPVTVAVLELLRRTTIDISPLEEIERTFERRRLGTGSTLPPMLLSVLRDVAGGGSRRRALFLAAQLRSRLFRDFGIEVSEPAEWGLPAYRSMVGRISRIEIPGTGISGSSEQLFVWPRARDLDRSRPERSEDEVPDWHSASERSTVDLQRFPSGPSERVVIVAGPGYGKSALLHAVASGLARTPFVPAIVPLAGFAAGAAGVLEFLDAEINRTDGFRIDWARLAEQGAVVVLFDGLDEIPSNRRRAVLDRIARYSARHPRASWLLTVRDPSVLSGPADARSVELLPLDEADIVRFVDAMRAHVPHLEGWTFVRRLAAYPDVARLARIPLFLAMLLASAATPGAMPERRADLIEGYLRTLFSPHEHKETQSTPVAGSALRCIAEALAFERIGTQEIGASEREVLQAAARLPVQGETPDSVRDRLLNQGVLRRQGMARLQFPYPIVQEYLAACHLAREHPETIPQRIDDAMQRPWAQVLQFAIELLPEPSPVMAAMLARGDDAFHTGLRLVARCIVNGARADASLRADVAKRLAAVWPESTWQVRERVGRLIVDGFSRPLVPEVRAVLGHRWLIDAGAGEIVTHADDPTLTREILRTLLDGGLDRYMNLRSLQPAIDRLGDEALEMYAARARDVSTSTDQLAGLAGLIGSMHPDHVTPTLASSIAEDASLPDEVRLQAYSIVRGDIGPKARPVVERALRSSYHGDRWAAVKVLRREPDAKEAMLRVLADESLDFSLRREIAGGLGRIRVGDVGDVRLIRDCVQDAALSPYMRTVLLALMAGHGDADALQELVSGISTNDLRVANVTVALLGHHPDRVTGMACAEAVRARVTDGAAMAAFASSAATGMTSVFEMTSFDIGFLRPTKPHPAIDVWADLVEAWMDRNDTTEVERITIAVASRRLGSLRAMDRLEALILGLGDLDDPRFDREDENGLTIRGAIDELRIGNRLLPLPLAVSLVRTKRPNIPFVGVDAVAAHGDHRALRTLIDLHNDPASADLRGVLSDAVERLASRLGVTIVRSGRNLLPA